MRGEARRRLGTVEQWVVRMSVLSPRKTTPGIVEAVASPFVEMVRGMSILSSLPQRWDVAGQALRDMGFGEAEISDVLCASSDGFMKLEDDILRDFGRLDSELPAIVAGSSGGADKPDHRGRGATWEELDKEIAGIEWLWRDWLPKGMLVILAGSPGSGKSALALRIAATFVRGDVWPDGSEFKGENGSVLWLEAEAGQAVNVGRARDWGIPKGQIVGAPLPHRAHDVRLADRTHREAIESEAHQDGIRLIVLDSLSAATAGQQENKSTMIQPVLWLAKLARDTGVPVLVLHHTTKPSRHDPADVVTLPRVRGFGGIVQPARVVWGLDAPDSLAPESRRLHVIKSNLAAIPEALGVSIGPDGVSFGRAPMEFERRTRRSAASEFLMDALKVGPVPSSALKTQVEAAGLNWRTVQRARAKLPIDVIKSGDGWVWQLRGQ